MKSKGNAPTAAQKRWREAVRGLGSVISGAPAVIHHPVGCTGKHNKIAIGHWWILPLTDEEHKLLHLNELKFKKTRKTFEKLMYKKILNKMFFKPEKYIKADDFPPFAVDVAIEDYHK